MNILGDFINRVNALYPLEIENDELNALLTTIRNQGDEIEMKDAEITRLKARLEKLEPEKEEKPAAPKKTAPKKPAAKKLAAKKPAAKEVPPAKPVEEKKEEQ
jgi:alpha-amylase